MTIDDDQKHGLVGVIIKRLRNSIKTFASTEPSCSMNRNSPCALIAEIMFSEKRRPVAGTTGVCPLRRPSRAGVVIRADARLVASADRRPDPFGFWRIAGLVSVSGMHLHGILLPRLVSFWSEAQKMRR